MLIEIDYDEMEGQMLELIDQLKQFRPIVEHVATDGAEITPELVAAARKALGNG
jgi:hypothetical protein